MKRVPIEEARQIAEKLGADAVIVIAFKGEEYCTTSYGKDRATCAAFSEVCDQIHEDISDGIIPIPKID